MPPDEVTDWASIAPGSFKPSPEIIAELHEIERRDGQAAAYDRLREHADRQPAHFVTEVDAPEPKPKRRDDFRPPQSEAGRIAGDEGWRELRDIERHTWESEREYQAMLFAILRIAHTGKRWIAIGRRELARKLGCDGKTAYKVLQKLVDDGHLISRSPERRFDPKTRRYNADEYTFPRLAEP